MIGSFFMGFIKVSGGSNSRILIFVGESGIYLERKKSKYGVQIKKFEILVRKQTSNTYI